MHLDHFLPHLQTQDGVCVREGTGEVCHVREVEEEHCAIFHQDPTRPLQQMHSPAPGRQSAIHGGCCHVFSQPRRHLDKLTTQTPECPPPRNQSNLKRTSLTSE